MISVKTFFLVLLIFPFLTIAQTEENHVFKNKIAAGGFYDGSEKYFEVSYSKILQDRNELIFSADYITNGNSKEFIGGMGVNYSCFKRETKFNFMVGAFLGFNYYYYHYYVYYPVPNAYETLYYSYGPGLYLNLSPSYRIHKRISLNLDIKMGGAYQINSDSEHPGFELNTNYENRWTTKGTIAFKVGYAF